MAVTYRRLGPTYQSICKGQLDVGNKLTIYSE